VRRALRLGGRALRVLAAALVLLVAVPGSAVRPTTLTLTKVEKVEAYDVGRDVVWVLVLGLDQLRNTDAIQLLGVDARTGVAAAIGIPRDSYVDLHGDEGMGRINRAYTLGEAPLTAQVVDELVGIEPDYVLATEGEGFVAMVDALGGVTVDSPLAFTTEVGKMAVHQGANDFDGEQALDFADTRIFPDQPGPGDFLRASNHQALLLGLLRKLRGGAGREGFVEDMARAALDGIDGADASPLELYKLLNLLTSVDPLQAKGCTVTGAEKTLDTGDQVIVPDHALAERLGQEAVDDATFESGCAP
jgi:polyisoprenyl-teichoic acid--peptidoglycan teichoic acid transferase